MTKRAPKTERQAAPRHNPRLAARSIDGHILRTSDETWAWFRLHDTPWFFRDDAPREQSILNDADLLAELVGMWCHERVTSMPWPASEWGRAHHANAVRRLPDVRGAVSYRDYMIGEQEALGGWALSNQQTYLGVQVGTRTLSDRACAWASTNRVMGPWVRRFAPELLSTEDAEIAANLAHVETAVRARGGAPATPEQMDWLMHRSVSLGLPPGRQKTVPNTGVWEVTDLESYADEVVCWQEPRGPSVTLQSLAGRSCGQQRSTMVLSLGRQEELDIPQQDLPWMAIPDQLGIPYEWSARFLVRHRDSVTGELTWQAGKAQSQIEHHEEHGKRPPPELARQSDLAVTIDDELSSGVSARSTRVSGVWRLAVSGADEDEAHAQALRLEDAYTPKTRIERTEAQYAHYREFIPGEPVASVAHRRRGDVRWAASGMPTVAHRVGDRRGIVLGHMAQGPPCPVALDQWAFTEQHDSHGLGLILGGLGSGKSQTGMMLMYKSLRVGAEFTVHDPSGLLAQLCYLPEIAPFARHIDLMQTAPGILNPYRVVPEPVGADFTDELDPVASLRRAKEDAEQTRRDLVIDFLTKALPWNLTQDGRTDIVMSTAVSAVAGRRDAHPGLVIHQLHNLADDDPDIVQHAQHVAKLFTNMRPKLRSLIPERDADPYQHDQDNRLTVFTMPGLQTPKEGSPQPEWTPTEMFNAQLLGLAAWLTQRNLHDRPRWVRKGLLMDEFFLGKLQSGRWLIDRAVRETRKYKIRIWLLSQIPADVLEIPGIAALVDAVIGGRLSDPEAQAQVLELAKVPTGLGYEQVLGGLPQPVTETEQTPREFLFADGTGHTELIRCDFSAPHLAHVLTAGDTKPVHHPEANPEPEPEPGPEPAAGANGAAPPWRRTVDALARRGNGAHTNEAVRS